MKHPIVMMCYNQTPEQLELTKTAVESVFLQDVEGGVELWLADNGSTPETWEWMRGLRERRKHVVLLVRNQVNVSPVAVANAMTRTVLQQYPYVLGVPNDVEAPPNLYSEILKCPRGLVAAWMNGNKDYNHCESAKTVHEDCHMSVALARRWCYDALMEKDGHFFDERFFNYCSDVDIKLRLAALGIHGAQLDIECWHYGSASWRLAPEASARAAHAKADEDRSRFVEKWGFSIGSLEHQAALKDINFRGIVRP